MKRNISAKIDENLFVHIKNKPNISRYIEELIKQDIQMQQKKPIIEAVRTSLLEDEYFIAEISRRIGANKGVTMDTQVVTDPDWGAYASDSQYLAQT